MIYKEGRIIPDPAPLYFFFCPAVTALISSIHATISVMVMSIQNVIGV